MPQPALRSGGPTRGRRRGSPEITFTPRTIKLIPLEGSCRIHGPDPLIQVVATNAAPPYVWTDGGVDTITDEPLYRAHYALADGHFEVFCRWQDSHSSLFVSDSIRCDPVDCRPGQTNFLGAGWTSTHNPTNAADHAPGIFAVDRTFGPLCPVAHDIDVWLGWTHDTTILNIRNLVQILTGNAAYDRADHCIGIKWSQSGSVALTDFLDLTTKRFLDRLQFVVNSSVRSSPVSIGGCPDMLYPIEWIVELRLIGSSEPLDTLVICIFNPGEDSGFTDWRTKYSSVAWTSALPAPPRTIPSSETSSWYAPGTPGSYMHHDAVHDIRSKPVAGGHGHQATYGSDGLIITNGTIAAGTADYVSPESMWDGTQQAHREQDVKPYIWALHLDGNPGKPDNLTGMMTGSVPSRLSRPCIFQGTQINRYIQLRPSFPTGIQEDE